MSPPRSHVPRAVLVACASLAVLFLAGCSTPTDLPSDPGSDHTTVAPSKLLFSPTTQRVILEVDVDDDVPVPARIAHAARNLETLLQKPVILEIAEAQLPEGTVDIAGLLAAHQAHFDRRDPDAVGNDTEAWIHVLVLNASHENPLGPTSGLTPTGTNVVGLYQPGLDARWAAAPEAQRATWHPNDLAFTVLLHEFGHVLGLVDCPIPMTAPREDPQSECHSSEAGSIMGARIAHLDTWPQERVLVRGGPAAYTPFEFTEADLADVAAARPDAPA